MKRTIRILALTSLAGVLAVSSAMPADAQRGQRGPRTGQFEQFGRGLDALQQKLNLSEEQAEQVRATLLQHREEGRAWMRSNRNASAEERSAFMDEHRSALVARLSDTLTEEQLEIVQETVGSWRGTLGTRVGRRGAGPGVGPGLMHQRLVDRLDLTAEQQEQIRSLQQGRRTEMFAWREANPEATREEIRSFRLEHMQQMRSDLESVLTDDQLSELRAAIDARGERGSRRPGMSRGKRGNAVPRGGSLN